MGEKLETLNLTRCVKKDFLTIHVSCQEIRIATQFGRFTYRILTSG